MKAFVVQSRGVAAVVEVDKPPVRDEYIRIKTQAVALNPTDWKHRDFLCDGGEVLGADVAGIVEEVGSKVTSPVKEGDRVAGFTHGGNLSRHKDGGFAEYTEIKDGLFIPLPSSMPWAEAATLGAGTVTAGQALYQSLKLPLPDKPSPSPFPILIYGASTASGTLMVQYAKLSGLEVLTTSSPKHFELLKSLGASTCYDYNEPNVGTKIRRDTGDDLRYVLDCITDTGSMQICAEALASNEDSSKTLHASFLLDPKGFPRNDAGARWTIGYTATGETFFKIGKTFEGSAEDHEFARRFFALSSQLLHEGTIKPHPVEERDEGLEGITDGLKDLKSGSVRGKKLVYML